MAAQLGNGVLPGRARTLALPGPRRRISQPLVTESVTPAAESDSSLLAGAPGRRAGRAAHDTGPDLSHTVCQCRSAGRPALRHWQT
eukprot:321231-Hanusia_phi.AAC.1